jgi:predicted PurR-regulated permease PerM
MGLLRYQIFLVYLVGLISLWISLRGQKSWVIQTITPLIPESYSTSLYYPLESIVSNLIDYAPILFILALGVYALLSVAYGVFMLRDCPEASKELEHQIQQAREDMIRRGIMKHVKA